MRKMIQVFRSNGALVLLLLGFAAALWYIYKQNRQIRSLKSEISDLRSQMYNLESEKSELEEALEECEWKVNDLEDELDDCEYNLRSCRLWQ